MITLNLQLLVLCFVGAFFFAGSETGFMSWNAIKIAHRAREGDLVARWALYLMRYRSRMLSAVLIGNNVSVVGASLTFLYLFSRLNAATSLDLGRIPSPESWFLSPLLVVFGEMLPKTLFRIYSFRLTLWSTPLLAACYWIAFPFSVVLCTLASLVQRCSGGNRFSVTRAREEMVLIAREGHRQGTLFESVTVLIAGILKLRGKVVTEIIGRALSRTNTGKEGWLADCESAGCARERRLPRNCGTLPVHDGSGRPVGWVSVWELLDAPANQRIHGLMHTLGELDGRTPALSLLGEEGGLARPMYRVMDQGETQGMLKRSELLELLFDGPNCT